MGRGRPIDSSSWPSHGPGRRFAELLDRVHRENGVKSLRTVAAAMNLRFPSRVSALLRMKVLPADGSQARMLIKALGGSAEDIERGLRLYRAIMSAPQDTGRSGRAQLHAATITADPAIIPAVAAGASSPANVRWMLPRDIPEFTGREEELRALLGTVEKGMKKGRSVPICVIDGMAGIGKTTLAVQAAHMLRDRFPDRQLFVNLHGYTPGREPVRPEDALAGLLAASGVDPRFLPADLDGRAGMWRDRVAGQRMLLLLDNAAGSTQVAPLLPGGEGCLVVVTSRRHLGDLDGAVVPVLLDTLRPQEAEEMFTRLAPRAAGNPGLVAEVVRLAGFLPLAISLLARVYTRHQSWTLADLAAETKASLLTMTAEDESIAAAFAVSYRHLDPTGQRFFWLLGLHPGGTTDAYAAAALAGASAGEAARLLDGLHGEGLLAETGYRRYGMHDLLRRYARDHAAGLAGGGQEALERLLDYYQHAAALAGDRLTRQTRPGLAPPSPAGQPATLGLDEARQALAWVRADRSSLLACLDHATRTGQHARVIAFTGGLAELLRRDGPWADAIARHTAAAEAARHLGDRLDEATALTDRATVQRQAGDNLGAIQAYEQAGSIFRDLGDRLGQANALTGLGTAQWLTNDYRGALRALEQALAIYRDLSDQLGQASALDSLGTARRLIDDYPGAAQALSQALSIYRDLSDQLGQANVLTDLGIARQVAGEHAAAARDLEQALGIFRDLGDRLGQASALNYLGTVRRQTGDYPGAIQVHDQALEISRDLGDRHGEANALKYLGIVWQRTNEHERAAQTLEHALRIYCDLSDRLGQAATLTCLGTVLRETGDYQGAAENLEQALGIYQDLRNRGGEVTALNERGTLHRVSGNPTAAERCHQTALKLARAIAYPWDQAHALAGLARCAIAAGNLTQGQALLGQAQEIFERIDAPESRTVLAELDTLRGPQPTG